MNQPLIVRTLAVVAAAATLSLVAAGCSGGGNDEAPEVAATVGGAKIRSSELESLTREYLESHTGRDIEQQVGEDEMTRLVLGFRIKHILLGQVAEKMGVTAPPDPLEEGFQLMAAEESYRQAGFSERDLVEANRSARLSKALAEKIFPQVPVPEEDVRKTFEQQGQAFGPSWRVGADIAIFDSAAAASQLRERVLGGQSFEEVAQALGAIQQGAVEVTPISPIPQVLIDEVGKLRQGEVSAPVAAGSSWFTARVNQREEFAARSFEEVRAEVEALLADQKRQSLFQDWFTGKLRGARIHVDEFYGTWDPSAGTVQG